jgi:hypothetical protein
MFWKFSLVGAGSCHSKTSVSLCAHGTQSTGKNGYWKITDEHLKGEVY